MARWPGGEAIVDAIERAEPRETLARAIDIASIGGSFLVSLFTFLFVGLFLSIRPSLYFTGLVRLFPKSRRKAAGDLLNLLGGTLHSVAYPISAQQPVMQ